MALNIQTSESDGKLLVTVEGEVDLYTSPDMRAKLLDTIPNAGSAVGVNLSAVPYMDSSGIATLVEALKAARDKNIAFILVSPSKSVHKVLELARLDTVFTIQDTL